MRPDDKVRPPLLRRLTEADPAGKLRTEGFTANDLLETLRRDLENLLNARRRTPTMPDDLPIARDSMLAFGLPELSSLRADTHEDWQAVGARLKEALERHDPRLRDVQVTVGEESDGTATRRFHVRAELCVEPARRIAFDTVLKLFTGAHEVHMA